MPIRKHTDEGFAPVTDSLIEDQRLSPAAFKSACYILRRHPDWKISAKDVAEKTGMDRRNVTRAFDNLEACGYMRADRKNINGVMCRTNIEFSNKPEFTPYEKLDKPVAKPAAKPVATKPKPEAEPEQPVEPEQPEQPRGDISDEILGKEDTMAGAEAYARVLAKHLVFDFNVLERDIHNPVERKLTAGPGFFRGRGQ